MLLRIILKLMPLIIILFFGCQTRETELKSEGKKIINKIEKFKLKKDRLPNNFNEIGVEERLEGPLYYQKIDSNNYIVWFGTSVGESVTYSSETKKWDDE